MLHRGGLDKHTSDRLTTASSISSHGHCDGQMPAPGLARQTRAGHGDGQKSSTSPIKSALACELGGVLHDAPAMAHGPYGDRDPVCHETVHGGVEPTQARLWAVDVQSLAGTTKQRQKTGSWRAPCDSFGPN
jgi:hypothetical protein